jgi:hypothetical protein
MQFSAAHVDKLGRRMMNELLEDIERQAKKDGLE